MHSIAERRAGVATAFGAAALVFTYLLYRWFEFPKPLPSSAVTSLALGIAYYVRGTGRKTG